MGISDCFENINMPPCVWFEGGDKRNAYASMLAGFLVSFLYNVYSCESYL